MSKKHKVNPEEVKEEEVVGEVIETECEVIDEEPEEKPNKRKKLLLAGGIAIAALVSGGIGMLIGKHNSPAVGGNWGLDDDEEEDDDEDDLDELSTEGDAIE